MEPTISPDNLCMYVLIMNMTLSILAGTEVSAHYNSIWRYDTVR